MQSAEERKQYYRVIIKTCYIANIVYLLCHILYFIVFLIDKIYPLVYINLVSIAIYCFCFFVLHKKKYYYYALICGNEILVYMACASVLVGFDSGFHLCIIGVCVVSFFSTYFAKVKRKIVNSLTWCGLSFAVVTFMFFYSVFNKPAYQISEWLRITLYYGHTIAIFAFIAAYLSTFLNYAMKLEDRILIESRTDKLTQLHNRYDLYNYVGLINDKTDYALGMFDIDDFKVVNDKFGHLCGDDMLKELSDVATEVFADGFVSRYGGEEFIVIVKMNGNVDNAINKFENFRRIVEEHNFHFNNRTINITITIGLAAYENEQTIEEWIGHADKKLYYGKNSGKNQTVYTLN